MADDAPPALPPREAATPPELPPRESVEALSLEEDVADLDAAAEDEGYEDEAADAAEELPEAPLTEEEEEARGVAQHLLLNAPPGEFTELLEDVASLTPERALEGGFVNGVARARNAQILETAITKDGARVMLCREAEVTPTTFRDANGKLYDVDHATLSAVSVEDVYDEDAVPESLKSARDELQKQLAVYASTRYLGEGHAATFVVGDALKAVVRGSRKNLGNFHSGSWASAWTLTPSSEGYDVQGMIQVRAHYFEDGNVQLYATKDVTASTRDVAQLIEEKENALHAGLEAMYGDMADATFKALRRVMPIMKLKMKWSVDALRLKGGLTRAAAEV